jgi:hypothetical protein
LAATPKINPKMDTVPSSMPNTMVPADLTNEARKRWKIDVMAVFLRTVAPSPRR